MSGQNEIEVMKSGLPANHPVTVGDLEKFKNELLSEIHRIVKSSNGQQVKKWLKSSEVRKLLHVSPGKLQTMRKSGALAYMRIGGSLYYDHDDINRMFEDSKVK